MGQLGINDLKNKRVFTLVQSLKKEHIVEAACGGDFSVVLNKKGQVFTFGSPEYGQLGNGTTAQHFITGTKLAFAEMPDPYFVKHLKDVKIVSIACGTNHVLAMSREGFVWAFGHGGYGRLGINEQKDKYIPESIPAFAGTNQVTRATAIACGSSFSMALDGMKQLFLWGKWKMTGDGSAGQPWMYPRAFYELNGWSLKCISGGNSSLFCVPEKEPYTISWGQGCQYGELGYGDNAMTKSSNKPQKCEPLEGVEIMQVSCGYGHTLFLAKPGSRVLSVLFVHSAGQL